MSNVQAALTIDDLKTLARQRVPKMFFEYANSGALTEQTYRSNERDFSSVLLRQRVARDISNVKLGTKLIGQDVSLPLALSPTGMTGMQRADGEILAAKAAEKFGVPFTLSTLSICSMEDVAAHTTKPFWFQLYIMRDRDFMVSLMERAKKIGCSALVLTLDLQVMAQRHSDKRNGLSAPPKMTPKHLMQMAMHPMWCMRMLGTRRHVFGNVVGHVPNVTSMKSLSEWTNEQFDPTLVWDDINWVKEQWGGKLILKGINDPEDAVRALDYGADAIIVSNHGGRQLDGAPSTIRTLPEIAAAVEGKIELHLDGGVRTGVDIARALALGAKGVFVGRPFLYGLGAGGEKGVTRCLEIFRDELEKTIALAGERDVDNLGPHNIYPGSA